MNFSEIYSVLSQCVPACVSGICQLQMKTMKEVFMKEEWILMVISELPFVSLSKRIFVWHLEIHLHVNQTQFNPEDDLVSKTFGVFYLFNLY